MNGQKAMEAALQLAENLVPEHPFTARVLEDYLMVCSLKSNRITITDWRERFSDLSSALNPRFARDINACEQIAEYLSAREQYLRQMEGEEVLDGL